VAAVVRLARAPGLVLSGEDAAALAARVVIRFQLRAFAREEGRARAGEVEPVHCLRVATRRLRAALRLFTPVLPAAYVEWSEREVTWLATAIGAVRDLDVMGESITAAAGRLEPGLRGALGPLAVVLHDQREAAHAALLVTLDSARCRRLMDRLAAFAAAAPPSRQRDPLGAIAPSLVRPLLRNVLRSGRRLDKNASPEALHRLRVRAKRLRYALETLLGLGGRSTRKLVDELRRLQELLGEHQDLMTLTHWLRSTAESVVPPPATLLATGALLGTLARRARKLRRRFPKAWKRLDRRRWRERVLEEIGRRPTLRAAAR
jgi:CHAD domain-containing protein